MVPALIGNHHVGSLTELLASCGRRVFRFAHSSVYPLLGLLLGNNGFLLPLSCLYSLPVPFLNILAQEDFLGCSGLSFQPLGLNPDSAYSRVT